VHLIEMIISPVKPAGRTSAPGANAEHGEVAVQNSEPAKAEV
jgi:hypothetical protein